MSSKKTNLVMIGMPGSGKSTVGVVLAKTMNLEFIDSDILIQKTYDMRLAQIIEQYGDDGFRRIENDVNAGIQAENTVIATGGSVIYGREAMEHLKEIGTVIYLNLSYPNLVERLGDLHARGVTFKPGQTLQDLYNERVPQYEQWADITVPCDGKRLREVAEWIKAELAKL